MTHLWIVSLEIQKKTKKNFFFKKWKTRILRKNVGGGCCDSFLQELLTGCYFILTAKIDPNGCLTAHNVVKYPSGKYFLKHKPINVDLNGSTNDSDGTEAKKETFKKGRK